MDEYRYLKFNKEIYEPAKPNGSEIEIKKDNGIGTSKEELDSFLLECHKNIIENGDPYEYIETDIDFLYKHETNLSCVNRASLIAALNSDYIRELLESRRFYLVDLTNPRYSDKTCFEIFHYTIIGQIISLDLDNFTAKIKISNKYKNIIDRCNLRFHMIGEIKSDREFYVSKIIRAGLTTIK